MAGDTLEHRDGATNVDWTGSHRAIMRAVKAIHRVGDPTRKQREALEILAEDIGSTLEAASDLMEEAGPDTMLRWSIVNVVAGLGHPDTVEFLWDQARRDPGRLDPEGSCEQPVEMEVLVAVMAAEGLAQLAADGHRNAADALLRVLEEQPHRPVREVAANAWIACGLDRRVVEELIGDDTTLLDLRPATEHDLTVEVELADVAIDPRQTPREFAKPLDLEAGRSRQRPVGRRMEED